MLDRDPLDDVGDILAFIDRGLEKGVDLLPLDDLEGIAAAGEEVGDRLPGELVTLVLEAVDLDPILVQAPEAAQMGQRVLQLLALPDDERGLLDSHCGRRLDPVQDERVGDLLDEVEDIVQAADEGVDLLAIEGRDERRLETMADVVGDLVAAMLGVANLARSTLQDVIGPQHRLEEAGGAEDVGDVLDEEVEEVLITGYQAQSQRVLPGPIGPDHAGGGHLDGGADRVARATEVRAARPFR